MGEFLFGVKTGGMGDLLRAFVGGNCSWGGEKQLGLCKNLGEKKDLFVARVKSFLNGVKGPVPRKKGEIYFFFFIYFYFLVKNNKTKRKMDFGGILVHS